MGTHKSTDAGVNGGLGQPGWYGYGRPQVAALWTGEYWDGQIRPDASLARSPAKGEPRTGLSRLRWLAFMLVGAAIIAVSNLSVADNPFSSDHHVNWLVVFGWWTWSTAFGYVLVMSGVYYLVREFVPMNEVEGWRSTLAVGIFSGLLASVIATSIESWLEPMTLHVPFFAELWLSGPVEETSKLLIPILFYLFVGKYFRNPLNGFFLVFVSGATFGAVEGLLYLLKSSGHGDVVYLMATGRPFTEIVHPFLTAMAAAVIWLAAARAKRLWTLPGLLGWAGAMALHSIHDGADAKTDASASDKQLAEMLNEVRDMGIPVWVIAAAVLVISLIWAVILYQIMRETARELVPPTQISKNPKRWRPLLREWGNHGQVLEMATGVHGKHEGGERS